MESNALQLASVESPALCPTKGMLPIIKIVKCNVRDAANNADPEGCLKRIAQSDQSLKSNVGSEILPHNLLCDERISTLQKVEANFSLCIINQYVATFLYIIVVVIEP